MKAPLLALVSLVALAGVLRFSSFHDRGEPTPPVVSEGATALHYLWKPVRIGGGGFLTGQSADRTGTTHVVRADVQGAYIWSEAKDRWEPLVTAAAMPPDMVGQAAFAEGVYEVAVAPSDPDRIYLAVAGAVFVSRDRGAHFVRAWSADNRLKLRANGRYRFYGPFIWVDPNRPDSLLLGTPDQGLWRSDDAGAHWSRIDAVPPSVPVEDSQKETGKGEAPGIVLIAGPKPTMVWAESAGNGIFESTDGGRSFRPLQAAGPRQLQHGAWTRDGAFLGTDPVGRTVWRYRDGRWEDIGKSVADKPRQFATIVVNPADGAVFLFDHGGRGFRSSDGGNSWWPLIRRVTVEDKDPPWLGTIDYSAFFGVSSAWFDVKAPGRLWVTSGTGIFYADPPLFNLWLTWRSRTRGIEELVANDAIAPQGGVPLFAAWDFGIHAKPDLDAFSTTWGPQPRSLIAAQQIDWSVADPNFIVTNASDTRMGCCAEDGKAILAGYSEDGGKSWTRFPTLPVPPGTRADDPWAMSFGMIAVSSGDTRNIIWAPSFNRSPFYTKDRGRTWMRVMLQGEVGPFTGSHSAFTLSRRTLVADRAIGGRFYLMHSGEGNNRALQGLWQTEDGGATWVRVFDGEIAPGSAYSAKLRAVPGEAGHLFFTSSTQGVRDSALRRSMDGGASWSSLDKVTAVDDIAFGKAAAGKDYPAIYLSGKVGGRYGIWRSIDNAANWQMIAGYPLGRMDRVTVVAADLDRFGRVYLGYMGSGWVYGDAANCTARPPAGNADEDCEPVSGE